MLIHTWIARWWTPRNTIFIDSRTIKGEVLAVRQDTAHDGEYGRDVLSRRTFDEHHDPTGFLQRVDQLFERSRADNVCAFGTFAEELVDLFDGPVVGGDDETVIVHVQYKVLAHDGQADETDVGSAGGTDTTELVVGQKQPRGGGVKNLKTAPFSGEEADTDGKRSRYSLSAHDFRLVDRVMCANRNTVTG